ncbi:hypothetical protein IV203_005024 [Nitzschia inconspicua]|uniref:Uncharacterized protein n=1 Tax=Nitzschia inconspicua TaxID=303405 RepID=A0A9K3PFR9_9STRA|nr:hypothetical protein IV203_005024 [Nitzschia inconspicua]
MVSFHPLCRFSTVHLILLSLCATLPLSIALRNIVGIDQNNGFDTVQQDDRSLQTYRKIDDESLPLYENMLVLSTSTPWSYGLSECLDGHNWDNGTKPDNFTWYGLRVELPDDAVESSSFWFTGIASMELDRGFNQLYGEDVPVVVANITFRTTEPNPTIKVNLQDDLLWTPVTFNMDDVEDGDFVETTRGFAVSCLGEQTETVMTFPTAVDATFATAMSRMQLRSGTSPTSGVSSSLTVWRSMSVAFSAFLLQVLF